MLMGVPLVFSGILSKAKLWSTAGMCVARFMSKPQMSRRCYRKTQGTTNHKYLYKLCTKVVEIVHRLL